MNQLNYLQIILIAYFRNREFLSEYFYRESKKAEAENIGAIEYFKCLINANKVFLKDIEKRYYKRVYEIATIEDLGESKHLPPNEMETPTLNNYPARLIILKGLGYLLR